MTEHVFETLSSETLYQGAIFALRKDCVRMPGGSTANREIVEHYGAVAIVALDADGRIPLVFQYRHALGRRLWELPAGLLDIPGEAPQLTAARELQEEVGLHAASWQVLVDVNTSPGFSDESVRVYLASELTEVSKPEAHDEEADMTMAWFDLDEAVRLVLSGEIVNSLSIGGILAAHSVVNGFAEARPVDTPWPGKPTAFMARQTAR